jgi:hypothetical protein
MKLAISLCSIQIFLASSVAARLRVSPGTPAPTMAPARSAQATDPLLLAKPPTNVTFKPPTSSPTRGSTAPVIPLANLVVRGTPPPGVRTFDDAVLTCTIYGEGGATGKIIVPVPRATVRSDATNFVYSLVGTSMSRGGRAFDGGMLTVALGIGGGTGTKAGADGSIVLAGTFGPDVIPFDGAKIIFDFTDGQGATLLSFESSLASSASGDTISLSGGFIFPGL